MTLNFAAIWCCRWRHLPEAQIKTKQKKLRCFFKNERFYYMFSRISFDRYLISYPLYEYTQKINGWDAPKSLLTNSLLA